MTDPTRDADVAAKTSDVPKMAAFGAIIDLTAQLPPPPDHVERVAMAEAEMKDLLPFAALNLPDELQRAIDDLGFERTTPIQSIALPEALRGRDVLGQAQTGTGKTATFLITAFKELLETERRHPTAPRAVVIAPTRELAFQITEDAELIGRYTDFNTVAVFGGMDWERQARQLEDPVDLLVATPGRLMDYMKRGVVDLRHVQVVVVDEADRMFDMGFIQDIKYIMAKCGSDRQTLMFSATFPFEVTRLAQRFQREPFEVRIQPEQVAATTIEQILFHVPEFEKLQFLLWLLEEYGPKRCLVFVNTKRTGDWLNFKLWHNGWESGYISGDLAQRKRMALVEDFRDGKVEVMVATDVAARGLHIDDVDLVVNYEIPNDANDYVHRIGRTGRAGNVGRAITIADERLVLNLPEIERLLGHQLDARVPEDEMFLRDDAPSYRNTVLAQRRSKGGDSGRKRKAEVWSPSAADRQGRDGGGDRGGRSGGGGGGGGDSAEGDGRRRKRGGKGGGEVAAAQAAGGDHAQNGVAASGVAASGDAASASAEASEGARKKRRRRGGRGRKRRGGEGGDAGASADDGARQTGGHADGGGAAAGGDRLRAALGYARRAQAPAPSSAAGDDAKVAELVDALDSGSSELTLVGVQVPPFAPKRPSHQADAVRRARSRSVAGVSGVTGHGAGAALAVLLASALFGCARAPADRLVDESLGHLEAAIELLEAHAGDTQKLVVAVMQYRVAHYEDFRRLRGEGERLLAEMDEAERRDFVGRHRVRATTLAGRVEALAKRYPDERLVMRVVRPLMIVASPHPGKVGEEPPWMPPLPPPTPVDEHGDHAAAATATAAP
jgi:ATP-dependent RNA helicase RhlB